MIDNTSVLDYCCHDDIELASNISSSNSTGNDELSSVDRNSSTSASRNDDSGFREVRVVLVMSYLVICVVGLVGNTLVVTVIAKFAKMKTVTNVYILNLSVADGLFLVGLPMIATTSILKHWAFGSILCKVFYVLTSINMFTGDGDLRFLNRKSSLTYRNRGVNLV